MTYGELKEQLGQLTEDQLNQTVEVIGENERIKPLDLFVLNEDQVNPSGECWEPVSAYSDEEEWSENEIVGKAGEVYLM